MNMKHLWSGLAVLMLLVAGCGKRASVTYDPLAAERCPPVTIPTGALNVHVEDEWGCFVHVNRTRVIYEDGRVVERFDDVEGRPEVTGRFSLDRLKELDRKLTATGVFNERQGCWTVVNPEQPTVTWVNIAVQHNGAMYQYRVMGPGGQPEARDIPASVIRAGEIVRQFDASIDWMRPPRPDGGS